MKTEQIKLVKDRLKNAKFAEKANTSFVSSLKIADLIKKLELELQTLQAAK